MVAKWQNTAPLAFLDQEETAEAARKAVLVEAPDVHVTLQKERLAEVSVDIFHPHSFE